MSETLEHYDDTMQWLLGRAGELLGAEARPVELAWDVQRLFRRQTRRISRHGLREGPPTIAFADGRKGHALSVGMEVQTLAAPDDGFRFVQVTTPDPNIADFYAVAARDVRRFYRYVRKLARRTG